MQTIIVQSGAAGSGVRSSYEVGLLLNFASEKKGGLAIEILLVMDKAASRTFQRIPLAGNRHLPYIAGLPAAVGALLKKVTEEALLDYLAQRGFGWVRDAEKPFELLDERHYALLTDRMAEVLQELRPLGPAIKHLFYLPEGEPFQNRNVRPAAFSSFSPSLHFTLEKEPGSVRLRCSVGINGGLFPLYDFLRVPFFLRSGNEFFLLRKEDYLFLKGWHPDLYTVGEGGQAAFLAGVVRPLAEKYPVNMDAVIRTEVLEFPPQARVYVSELNENFLLIKPKWLYGNFEVEDEEEEQTRIEEEEAVYVVQRKREEEKTLLSSIRDLHGKFEGQSNGYFYLNFKEALEKSWFLRFYHKMQEMDVPVLGMNKLRKFKYNTHVPTFEIVAGRGIDWFDLTIRVSYGDQVVPLQDLRKAILGRQDFILLSDGSLGMLPKEWIEKYSLLMKMGQVKEGGMKLPAVHWSLLEETGSGSIEEALQQELAEKKARLQGISTDRTWPVPAVVQAKLRDYQLAGFQWMCLLDEMGWGGCLADDMGLGKTLQTISFLQHLVEQYPEETHLVVCPTSLLYNWEGELKKFAPGLAWHVHYGADRQFDEEAFRKAHIIITSYGMVRNDSEHFAKWKFGYIILDESHAIKNPGSQVRKAVQLLQGRNRIALSGTPVQNNTFDLYTQMDFLNPGMLGSAEFFRGEFATPIDKNGDKEAAMRLRKLVYPFMLRRTKEQVAKDLPDKTEMILWCEMGAEQRKIYDSFKEHYRENLLERIESEGLGKSSIFILEGLTKLRQICDSPALLKEGSGRGPEGVVREPEGSAGGPVGVEEAVRGPEGSVGYPNESAKLEELIREIEENMGGGVMAGDAGDPATGLPGGLAAGLAGGLPDGRRAHKALVFSQFTSMLQLIRQALEERGISYLYLDGSVPAEARKQSVQRFQEDESVRVFLISLKAGGVGLTLTAADYVYLVDPWWNPAAEQQAIDRSHRIGQVNKVFAYRMICKDTVEEKILQLQERKKSLAADLIADEAGFVKKLTQEDVAYLFS